MYIVINNRELDALQGTDYTLLKLYLYIKSLMDFDTGIAGYKRRFSYQSISEHLYIEPRQGVKGGKPHKSHLQRMLKQLQKIGLLDKIRNDTLVFKLPFADSDFYTRKKADKKSIPKADTPKASDSNAFEPIPDTPKNTKADTPHYITILTTTTTTNNNLHGSNQETENRSSSSNLIFSKKLDKETCSAMQELIKNFEPELQQQLLDEMSGYIEKGKIQSTPMALLYGMVERAKVGAFVPSLSAKVKLSREQRKQEMLAASVPKPEKSIDKAKGREAMSNVRDIFNKRKNAQI